jgi:glycosyltransferase involved in cell wall biosynthesis
MLDLTALILTYNERENIDRALDRLQWIKDVIVLDSFSTDETCEIAKKFPNVRVVQRKFDSFAGQCNYGLSIIQTEWVLSIDADYLLSDELVSEIRALPDEARTAGYSARFRYCIGGVPLRRSLLPPRTIIYRRSQAIYENEGHGHRVRINGEVAQLNGYIFHDDRKPLRRWLQDQDKYSVVEARHLLATGNSLLPLQDRLRKMIFVGPLIMPFYLLIGYGLILDGWPGWYYVFQRTVAELLLSLRLLEAKLQE